MTETILYGLLVFTFLSGLCLVYGIVETEFQSWKHRRRIQNDLTCPRAELRELKQPVKDARNEIVRGYDSADLFRKDALIRIRELEREIARDLKEIERDRSKLLPK